MKVSCTENCKTFRGKIEDLNKWGEIITAYRGQYCKDINSPQINPQIKYNAN